MRPLTALLAAFALAAAATADGQPKIDRTVTKEPAYKAKPRYCLVVVGPEPKSRVWLVLDGETLYVDRDGTGDITRAERVKPQESILLSGLLEPGQKPPRALRFPCAVTKDITVDLMTINGQPVQVDVRDAGRKLSLTAYADDGGPLKFSDRPAAAPVILAGGRLTLYLPAGRTLRRGPAENLFITIGARGLGAGTFAALSCDSVPQDLHPVADIEFPAKDGGKAIRKRFTLDRRC
jgi:hypothetical protein